MPEVNRASDANTMQRQLADSGTARSTGAIEWAFPVGDRAKIG
jgi:hypothetical protein